MISDIIKVEFEKKILKVFQGKDDLIHFFLSHPLREKLFIKVHSEIVKAEIQRPGLLTDRNIRDIAQSFAIVFCKQALLDKEQELLTDAQKIKQQQDIDNQKYLNTMMQEAEMADNKDLQ